MFTLTAEERPSLKPSEILQDKKLPAVMYGPGSDNISMVLNYEEFRKLIPQVRYHQVIQLEYKKKKYPVLVKDFQKDLLKDTYTHIDFYSIDPKQKVIVPVPVEFEGDSPAIKVGALLTVTTSYIKVEALPGDIPAKIIADISILELDGDKIRLENVPEIKNVKFMAPQNTMLAKTELSRASKKSLNEDEEEAGAAPADEAATEEKPAA
jgi:large subunit ribosomal protein L25